MLKAEFLPPHPSSFILHPLSFLLPIERVEPADQLGQLVGASGSGSCSPISLTDDRIFHFAQSLDRGFDRRGRSLFVASVV